MTASRLMAGRRGGMMAQTDAASATGATRGGAGVLVWIFRVLLVAGGAFMVYSWFQPWWSGNFVVIPGEPDMVLHPWGVDAVSQVRTNVDESLFQMPFPEVFAGFMWVYLVVCMLGLAVSLFWTKRLKLGPINVSYAMLFILLVGISYAAAVGIAYEIGTLKAAASGAKFIGNSNVLEPATGARVKMTSQLELGFWLSLAAGGVLTFLGLIRFLFVRQWGKKA
jgi:hypothetical protein